MDSKQKNKLSVRLTWRRGGGGGGGAAQNTPKNKNMRGKIPKCALCWK